MKTIPPSMTMSPVPVVIIIVTIIIMVTKPPAHMTAGKCQRRETLGGMHIHAHLNIVLVQISPKITPEGPILRAIPCGTGRAFIRDGKSYPGVTGLRGNFFGNCAWCIFQQPHYGRRALQNLSTGRRTNGKPSLIYENRKCDDLSNSERNQIARNHLTR
ncbi:MAG: hypothetical protein HOH22_01065 [Rhodospirillaceae bacterium]|nr:hypothetical protein [Rhodospirillaceae bacterium]